MAGLDRTCCTDVMRVGCYREVTLSLNLGPCHTSIEPDLLSLSTASLSIFAFKAIKTASASSYRIICLPGKEKHRETQP